MRKIVICALAVTLTGCSTSPDKVKPTPILGQPFASYECDQLEAERVKAASDLEIAKSTQSRRVEGEAVGLIAVGVTGLLLAKAAGPDDQVGIIGSLRGNIAAMDAEATRKKCASPEFGKPEPIKVRKVTGSSANKS